MFKQFRLFQAIYKKIRFSRQKLVIYSCFWANYSIAFQKSPLSNILPVHDKQSYNNISRPVQDLLGPPAQNLTGREPPTPRSDAPNPVGPFAARRLGSTALNKASYMITTRDVTYWTKQSNP